MPIQRFREDRSRIIYITTSLVYIMIDNKDLIKTFTRAKIFQMREASVTGEILSHFHLAGHPFIKASSEAWSSQSSVLKLKPRRASCRDHIVARSGVFFLQTREDTGLHCCVLGRRQQAHFMVRSSIKHFVQRSSSRMMGPLTLYLMQIRTRRAIVFHRRCAYSSNKTTMH